MKTKIILILLAMFYSSCGIFQKIEKVKSTVENNTEHKIVKDIQESDQGIIKTTESWRFKVPTLSTGLPLSTYSPPDIPSISGDANALAKALSGVNTENKWLLGQLNDLKDFYYSKETLENKNAKKDTKEVGNLIQTKKEELVSVKKTPAVNYTLVIIVCFSLALIFAAILILYSFRNLKKDIQVLKNITGPN